MPALLDLWLPVVLSAVFVFVASSVIHMATPMHKGDMKKLPSEEAILETLRAKGVKPGSYMFPCAESMKDMGTPEMIEKMKRGPVGFATVVPSGPPSIGKSLVWWFCLCLVVSVFTAYLGSLALARGADYHAVFRFTGTVAILGYALGNVNDSIWKGVRWGITLRFAIDGLIYGLVTAGTFGWLWPDAAA